MTIFESNFSIGSWVYSANHKQNVRIVDLDTVWEHTVCQVWVPSLSTVQNISAKSLNVAQPASSNGLDGIFYAAAAARVAEAMTQDVLLAPLEAGVIPLPHQLHALSRAMAHDRGQDFLPRHAARAGGMDRPLGAPVPRRRAERRQRLAILAPEKGRLTRPR